MSQTFEQGWAARPFKEQFPELSDDAAARLDGLNRSITDMLMNDLLTHSQVTAIRQKRMPRVVAAALSAAARKGQP